MNVAVILCTYNRCASLAKALESVARSTVPDSIQWKVLVIDNNSNDATRSVVEGFCRRDPSRFQYLFEPKQGKSHALNLGCRVANADVLAFMDDDVEVDSHWLHNLTVPFTNGTWSGVGGRILPEAGFVPQRWMDVHGRRGLAPLAVFDLGTEAGELNEAPFGTNMAFRKEVFEKYGDFRTDLGPQGEAEVRKTEDSEFGSRLLAAGERFWYEPSAIVYHAIPSKRANKKYFQTWWFYKGYLDVHGSGISNSASWQLFGIPMYLFRRTVMWTIRWLLSMNQPKRFSCNLQIWWLAGMMLEHYKQAHQALAANQLD